MVASKLSENPDWTVVLLEAGPEQPAPTNIPAFLNSAVGTKYDWKYVTVPQKHACLAYQGVCSWPRGKMLGGTVAMSGKYEYLKTKLTVTVIIPTKGINLYDSRVDVLERRPGHIRRVV